jgi:hypothetical protein
MSGERQFDYARKHKHGETKDEETPTPLGSKATRVQPTTHTPGEDSAYAGDDMDER